MINQDYNIYTTITFTEDECNHYQLLIEKDIAKKRNHNKGYPSCPYCGENASLKYEKYCCYCGQKLIDESKKSL